MHKNERPRTSISVTSPGTGSRGGRNKTTRIFFLAHKMARNDTLNKDRVATTELPQHLSQNTKHRAYLICLKRQAHKVAVRLCAALKLTEKVKLLEVEAVCAPVPHGWRRQWDSVHIRTTLRQTAGLILAPRINRTPLAEIASRDV